jgi:hypothetical protein
MQCATLGPRRTAAIARSRSGQRIVEECQLISAHRSTQRFARRGAWPPMRRGWCRETVDRNVEDLNSRRGYCGVLRTACRTSGQILRRRSATHRTATQRQGMHLSWAVETSGAHKGKSMSARNPSNRCFAILRTSVASGGICGGAPRLPYARLLLHLQWHAQRLHSCCRQWLREYAAAFSADGCAPVIVCVCACGCGLHGGASLTEDISATCRRCTSAAAPLTSRR